MTCLGELYISILFEELGIREYVDLVGATLELPFVEK